MIGDARQLSGADPMSDGGADGARVADGGADESIPWNATPKDNNDDDDCGTDDDDDCDDAQNRRTHFIAALQVRPKFSWPSLVPTCVNTSSMAW
jgi:hypothetical protein